MWLLDIQVKTATGSVKAAAVAADIKLESGGGGAGQKERERDDNRDKAYVIDGPCGTVVTIGRKDSNNIFLEDVSVSREHAVFEIGENDSLYITDLPGAKGEGSKFGTHHETNSSNPGGGGGAGAGGFIQLTTNQRHVLVHGATIRLGTGVYIKCLKTSLLSIACTRLDKTEKELLKVRLKKLKAKLVDEVTSDTHYIVSNRYFATVKILMALVHAKPVVMPQFFDFCDRIPESSSSSSLSGGGGGDDSNNRPLLIKEVPKISERMPHFDDLDIVDMFKPRRTLFTGYSVFVLENENDYINLLRGCGAKVVAVNAQEYSSLENLRQMCNFDKKIDPSSCCVFYNESSPIVIQTPAPPDNAGPINWLTSGNLAMAIIKSYKPTLTSAIPSLQTSSSSSAASQQQQQHSTKTSRQSSILVIDSNSKLVGSKRAGSSSISGGGGGGGGGTSDKSLEEDISPDILKDSIQCNRDYKSSSNDNDNNASAASKKHKGDELDLAQSSGDLFEEDLNTQGINRKSAANAAAATASSISKSTVVGGWEGVARQDVSALPLSKTFSAKSTSSTAASKKNLNKKAKLDDDSEQDEEKERDADESSTGIDVSNIAMIPSNLNLNLDTHVSKSPNHLQQQQNHSGKSAVSYSRNSISKDKNTTSSSNSNNNNNKLADTCDDDEVDYNYGGDDCNDNYNKDVVLLPGWDTMPRGSERSEIMSEKMKLLEQKNTSNSKNNEEEEEEEVGNHYKGLRSSSFVKSEPAVSIELDIISRSSLAGRRNNAPIKRSSEGAVLEVKSLQDKRKFAKNFVLGVTSLSSEQSSIRGGDVGRRDGAPIANYDPMFSLENMTVVLPKESEREIQLRLDYERFRNRTVEKEKLFSDRLLVMQKKNR